LGQELEQDTEGEKPQEEPVGYCVEWPELTSESNGEKAEVASKWATALGAYVSGGVEALVPPQYVLTRVMGMDDDDVAEMLAEAETAAIEAEAVEIEKQQAAIDQGLAPDPAVEQEIAMEAAKKGAPAPGMPSPGAPPIPPKPGVPPVKGPPKKPPAFNVKKPTTINVPELSGSSDDDDLPWAEEIAA
jgi:hypothetical protein